MLDLVKVGKLADIDIALQALVSLGPKRLANALQAESETGQTLLHLAVLRGDATILKRLLAYEVINIHAQDNEDKTALQLAEENNYQEMAALLRVYHHWDEVCQGGRYNLARISDYLSMVHQQVEKNKEKPVVFIMGATDAGKSTLTNYLLGCDYRIHAELGPGRLRAELISGVEQTQTGHGSISKTFYPNVVVKDEILYCDLPGLFSTLGSEAQIIAASSSEIVKNNSQHIQAILVVVSYSNLISSRALAFREIIAALKRMVGEHYETVLPALSLVVSQTEHIGTEITAKGILELIGDIVGMDSLSEDSLLARENQGALTEEERDLLKMLQSIYDSGRILISNITDKGLSRQLIIEAVNQSKPQAKEWFNFLQAAPAQIEFAGRLQAMEQQLNITLQRLQECSSKMSQELVAQEQAQTKLLELATKLRQLSADLSLGASLIGIYEILLERYRLIIRLISKAQNYLSADQIRDFCLAMPNPAPIQAISSLQQHSLETIRFLVSICHTDFVSYQVRDDFLLFHDLGLWAEGRYMAIQVMIEHYHRKKSQALGEQVQLEQEMRNLKSAITASSERLQQLENTNTGLYLEMQASKAFAEKLSNIQSCLNSGVSFNTQRQNDSVELCYNMMIEEEGQSNEGSGQCLEPVAFLDSGEQSHAERATSGILNAGLFAGKVQSITSSQEDNPQAEHRLSL